MDAVEWAMECYQEHLRGRRFIVYKDHKPLEFMDTLHTKTLNRLILAMLDSILKSDTKKAHKCQQTSCQDHFSRPVLFQFWTKIGCKLGAVNCPSRHQEIFAHHKINLPNLCLWFFARSALELTSHLLETNELSLCEQKDATATPE